MARLSIRLLLLAGSAVILLGVLGLSTWLSMESGRVEAGELFDARLATSARVLDSLMGRQIEHATISAPLVMSLPEPIREEVRRHGRAGAADAEAPLAWRLQDWLFGHHDIDTPLGHEYETHIAYQIWSNPAGAEEAVLLARSSSAPAMRFASLRVGFSDHALEDGLWRVFALQSGDVWIQVAERADAREELAAKLGWATGAPLLVGLVIVLLLTSLLIGYGLAPLSELAERISARRPQDDQPLSLNRVPAEIQPVLRALNGLFERVRNTLERERRFIDSAAHELRTPLAALRIHAQNARRADNDVQRDKSLDHLLEGVARTVHLTEQMLAHSRAGRMASEAAVSLRDVVGDAVMQRRPSVEASGHLLELVACDDDCALIADATGLSSMVGNLIDNAQRYAPAGTAIRVTLVRRDGAALLSVTDAGPGIPAELRERVLEPYYRIPGSAGSGTGLGLAIVREVLERLGGSIALQDGPAGIGTCVELTVPLTRPASVIQT